jgi:hypothetical protein
MSLGRGDAAVHAGVHVADDGTDEEQDQAGCGRDPEQRDADAHQEAERARRLEGAQREQPSPRDAQRGHVVDDQLGAGEVERGGGGVGGGGQDGDGDVDGEHGARPFWGSKASRSRSWWAV